MNFINLTNECLYHIFVILSRTLGVLIEMKKKNALIKSTIKCSKYNVILFFIDELHQFN